MKLLVPLLCSCTLLMAHSNHHHAEHHHKAQNLKLIPEIKQLEQKLKQQPKQLDITEELIQAYIKEAKRTTQTAYAQKAEALILEALKSYPNAYRIRMQYVDVLQYTHRFDKALKVLEPIVQSKPKEAEPFLQQAIIYHAKEEYANSLGACKQLILRSSHLLSTTCITTAQSYLGKLQESYEVLAKLYHKNMYHNLDERVWALTSLAEMAYRLEEKKQSLHYLQEAQNLMPNDHYVLKKLAEVYLELGAYQEVKTLLKEHQYVEALLLRLTVAKVTLGEKVSKETKKLQTSLKMLLSKHHEPHKEDIVYYQRLKLL